MVTEVNLVTNSVTQVKITIAKLVPFGGRDCVVGRATPYGLDGPWIESWWGARFSALVRTGYDANPASYTMGTGPLPGVKRPGRGIDHPPHLAPRLTKE